MVFFDQVLGIRIVYYVSFFCCFPCYYLSQRKGKNCGDDCINSLSIKYVWVGEYLWRTFLRHGFYFYHREQRNHGLKNESDCVRIGISIKKFMNHGRYCERSYNIIEFLSSTPQSNGSILSVSEQVFIPAVSHMKIANFHVGTIHQKVIIGLQF